MSSSLNRTSQKITRPALSIDTTTIYSAQDLFEEAKKIIESIKDADFVRLSQDKNFSITLVGPEKSYYVLWAHSRRLFNDLVRTTTQDSYISWEMADQ